MTMPKSSRFALHRLAPLGAALLYLVGLATEVAAADKVEPDARPVKKANVGASNDAPRIEAQSGITVFNKVSPAVVLVKASSLTSTAQGSGVAWLYGYGKNTQPNQTWVVTNAHVVSGTPAVRVEVAGKSYPGKVEYSDPDLDIALINLANVILPISKVGNSDSVSIGERVFAIGSPLGLENSITEGIVSAKRDIRGVRVIQTSAAISHGNSGGGLFNAEGVLVGITTFKLTSGESLNFAVDARYVGLVQNALLASELLRIQADSIKKATPADIQEINSGSLTKWLIATQAADGTSMAAYVLKIQDEFLAQSKANASEAWRVLESREVAVLERFLTERPASMKATASASGQPAKTGLAYRLTCPMFRSDGRFQGEMTFKVDQSASSVDGYPAQFTDEKIAWRYGDEGKWYASLNRYTGSLTIGSESRAILSGKCAKVTERQF